MVRCYEIVRRLGARHGIEMLTLERSDSSHLRATPNDVSDLASLIVEELKSLLPFYPEARTPARAYFPGDRFPAHVYQRVGLLAAILDDLLAGDS